MAYALERFGTLVIPRYDLSQDVGTGAVTPPTIPLPGGGLYDVWGTEQVPRQGGSINLTGVFLEASVAALYTAIYAWRGVLGKRNKLYRRVDASATVEWTWARLTDFQQKRGVGSQVDPSCDFSFLVLSPTWYGERHGDGWLFDAGEYFDTGLVFDEAVGDMFTLATASTLCGVVNNGNARVANAILTITAGSANITALTVLVSGVSSWTYAGTIVSGKSLVVDCGVLSVHNDGADDYHDFALNVAHVIDDWLRLEPGTNGVRVNITGGSTDSTIAFEFSDGWQ